MDAKAGKAALRQAVKQALATLPPARRALEEALVTAAVQADPAWRQARTVLLYHALPQEFSVVGLMLAGWRDGKRMALPRMQEEELALHQVSGWHELRPGRHGVREPDAALEGLAPQDIDLAVVPGLAFDRAGRRLGRGGGFYDRLVPRLACPAWGVGFDCQLVPEVPAEAHDARVAKVWTCQAQNLNRFDSP